MDDMGRNWLTRQEVDTFAGKNSDYYKENWNSHQNTLYFKGWNFYAFLFFFEWAAYRKMYREILAAAFCIFAFSIIFFLIPMKSDFISQLFDATLRIFFSAFANGLYHKKALRTLHKTIGMDDEAKMEYLAGRGGTSFTGMMVVCLIFRIIVPFTPAVINKLLY